MSRKRIKSSNRKYAISKINSSFSSTPRRRKRREQIYDGYVRAALAKVWQIFSCPFRPKTGSFKELAIMNSLYENELRLYKNFFCPVMKLLKKERVGAKVKRKYDIPKTPYQRLIQSGQISEEAKRKLHILYQSLNPAELKRKIEEKTHKLYQAYEEKKKRQEAIPFKRQTPRMVRKYMVQQPNLG